MNTLTLAFLLFCTGPTVSADETPTMTAGGIDPPLPLDYDRTVVWEDIPDLNGLIGSSEVIQAIDLQSAIANDFVLEQGETTVCRWTWWGGYFNYVPGDPLAEYFTVRIYDDGNCHPGDVITELFPLPTYDYFIYPQGEFPLYEYTVCECRELDPGRYWFAVWADDHPFRPQWGRVAADAVQGCPTVFKSAYFGVPDWVPATDAFGVAYEASLRLQESGWCPPAIENTSWGRIKGLFR